MKKLMPIDNCLQCYFMLAHGGDCFCHHPDRAYAEVLIDAVNSFSNDCPLYDEDAVAELEATVEDLQEQVVYAFETIQTLTEIGSEE